MNTRAVNSKTLQICLAGVMAAAVFVVTRFIQIPIPLGYFNVGNSVILLFCLIVGGPYAVVASAFGSALADFVSYPIYTVPTLIIKALMPVVFFLLMRALKGKKFAIVVAVGVSTLIPLFGYTLTGVIISGSWGTGIAQFPGLALEYAANFLIIMALYKPVSLINKR